MFKKRHFVLCTIWPGKIPLKIIRNNFSWCYKLKMRTSLFKLKRPTFHVLKLMEISWNNHFCPFSFDSALEKFDVWNDLNSLLNNYYNRQKSSFSFKWWTVMNSACKTFSMLKGNAKWHVPGVLTTRFFCCCTELQISLPYTELELFLSDL